MPGLLLFLAKPLLCLVAFAGFARYVEPEGPHWNAPAWLLIALARVGRLAAGMLGRYFAVPAYSVSPVSSTTLIVLFGFGWWLASARVAFQHAPFSKALRFAVLAELVSGTIDVVAPRAARPAIC